MLVRVVPMVPRVVVLDEANELLLPLGSEAPPLMVRAPMELVIDGSCSSSCSTTGAEPNVRPSVMKVW